MLICLTPAESAKLVIEITHMPVVARVTHSVLTDLSVAPTETVFRFAIISAEPVHREFTASVSMADPEVNAPQDTTVNPVGAVPDDATDQWTSAPAGVATTYTPVGRATAAGAAATAPLVPIATMPTSAVARPTTTAFRLHRTARSPDYVSLTTFP